MNAIIRKKWKLTSNQKGMTLIELMAVVVILGILASVVGVAVTKSFDTARTGSDAASIRIIQDAAQRYVLDKNVADSALGTIKVGTLVTDGYLQSEPKSQVDSSKAFFSLAVTKTGNGYTYAVTTAAAAQ